jgi:hypothetical protein
MAVEGQFLLLEGRRDFGIPVNIRLKPKYA